MGRKKYSKELKARIELDAIKGQKTIAELASEYGVHANKISLWKKQLLDAAPTAFSNGKDKDREKQYAALFSPDRGSPAKPFRMAFVALILKERLNCTDEKLVEQIRENPFDKLIDQVGLQTLRRAQYKNLLVIREVCRQQKEMFELRTQRVDY
jgi:transposase